MHATVRPFVACVLASLGACASDQGGAAATPPPGTRVEAAHDDRAPLDIADQTATGHWIRRRIDAGAAGRSERVRLPMIRITPNFDCDCPEFAVGRATTEGPFYWLALVDRTGSGMPKGPWIGWVEGRFTGALKDLHSQDIPGTVMSLPVFEALAQEPRSPVEPAQARLIREP